VDRTRISCGLSEPAPVQSGVQENGETPITSTLGVKFSTKGKTHYGWVRLSVSLPPRIHALITGYACETIPNMPIVAGRTKVSDEIGLEPGATVAPQPVTLGLLALETHPESPPNGKDVSISLAASPRKTGGGCGKRS
jgi:hypothetical protein